MYKTIRIKDLQGAQRPGLWVDIKHTCVNECVYILSIKTVLHVQAGLPPLTLWRGHTEVARSATQGDSYSFLWNSIEAKG